MLSTGDCYNIACCVILVFIVGYLFVVLLFSLVVFALYVLLLFGFISVFDTVGTARYVCVSVVVVIIAWSTAVVVYVGYASCSVITG